MTKWCKWKEKGKAKVKDEILQRIKAKIPKINRHQQRVSQFSRNRFFRNNEGRFYKQIDWSEEAKGIVIPDAQEAKACWTDIWAKRWNIIRMQLWEIKIWMQRTNRHKYRFHRRSWRRCWRRFWIGRSLYQMGSKGCG